MSSQATNDIIYFTMQYMGISDSIPFSEANIASYVVAMLPDKSVSTTDILDACSTLSEKYAYIDYNRLAAELSARILGNEKQEARTITLAHIMIGVAGYFIYKLFIKR